MPTIDKSHSSSYIRLIPLIMALVLSAVSFAYSLVANRSVSRPLLFWINGVVALVAAALVALAFGYTYQTYRSSIIKACQAVNMQTVRCASLAPKLEVILLGVALGLLVLASLLFGCVRKSNIGDTVTHEMYIDETVPSSKRQSGFLQSIQRNSKLMKSSSHLSESSSASKEPAMYGISNDDSLEAWRDVAILDGQQQYHHELGAIPLRPPPATAGRRSNEYAYKSPANHYDRQISPPNPRARGNSLTPPSPSSPYNSSEEKQYRQRQGSSSSRSSNSRQERTHQQQQHRYPQHYDLSNDSNELLPPTLPFAHQQQRRRKSSSSSPHDQPRPASHASGNTFGANEMLMDDSSSPLSSTYTLEHQHHHQQQRQYSDASSMPLSYQSDSRDSICFTPTFNDRSSSGISMPPRRTSSPTLMDHPQQQRRRQPSHEIPTLQTPPSARHPLNHKVIKDERIGAYFHQHQPDRSNTSWNLYLAAIYLTYFTFYINKQASLLYFYYLYLSLCQWNSCALMSIAHFKGLGSSSIDWIKLRSPFSLYSYLN